MIDPRDARSLFLTLAAALVIAAVLVRLDGIAARAAAHEAMGSARGQMVDRHGLPLAWSDATGSLRYALPGLAPVVGYRTDGGAWRGLEARYNGFLDATAARHDWRTFFLHLRGASARGGTMGLTVDSLVQRTAERALGSHPGAVVALDPRDGAVLAMVSGSGCPPPTDGPSPRSDCRGAQPQFNQAIQHPLPPGSSFKIVTLSAALDTGRFSLSSVFSGADAFGPSPYFDNIEYPSNVTRADLTQLTLAQALAFSDNFTFAHIGLTLGAPTFLRYAHRYYVGRQIPFDLPVARSIVANGEARPSLSTLAQSSFGGATDRVTPLQMALIAATVANGGIMMAPHLVDTLRTADGDLVWQYHPHVLSRVMSRQAARDVTSGMMFVVEHGSGFKAQIPGVAVAGKTGTAESGGDKPNAWFIAFAPAHHPVIAVAVLRKFSGEGFEYAAPVARKVLLAGLQEAGVTRAGRART